MPAVGWLPALTRATPPAPDKSKADMTISQSIARSASAFHEIVWPSLAPYMGEGSLDAVETMPDPHNQALDRQACVDHWITYRGCTYPVATRVRSASVVYNDFTIRRYSGGTESEYFKVSRAMERGAIYPVLSIVAYIDGTSVRSAAAVRTDLLWPMATHCGGTQLNGDDGNSFYTVPFAQFARNEICVIGPDAPLHLRRDIQPAPFIEETLWQ